MSSSIDVEPRYTKHSTKMTTLTVTVSIQPEYQQVIGREDWQTQYGRNIVYILFF